MLPIDGRFTALGVIPAIQHGVSYIAGYGLRLLLIIQTPSQVTDLYGRDATRTFFTNFGCQIVYPPREQSDADEYSNLSVTRLTKPNLHHGQ